MRQGRWFSDGCCVLYTALRQWPLAFSEITVACLPRWFLEATERGGRVGFRIPTDRNTERLGQPQFRVMKCRKANACSDKLDCRNWLVNVHALMQSRRSAALGWTSIRYQESINTGYFQKKNL